MTDPKQRMRDVYPLNDSFNAMEVATADRRFEQLIERRERLIERSRFGVLALNGASLIGLISSFEKVRAISGAESKYALAFFAAGMIFALLSIFFETNFVGTRAAQSYGHLSRLRRMRATLDDHHSERSERRFDEQLQELNERSSRGVTPIKLDDDKDGIPNDFAFSRLALLTLNGAGGAWIGGLLLLLTNLLK